MGASSDAQFQHAFDLAVNQRSDVYVADTFNNRIQVFRVRN
ncbi:hypothetical protein KC799_09105 [candidate division KSB1 bacterium]|nr:hypothetical protein [candidate division KSB1 bacterium]